MSHPSIGKRGASAASQRVFPSARTASQASESVTTETAYHDERLGRCADITPGRFGARDEAEDGAAFFIGIELPCVSVQPTHCNQFSLIDRHTLTSVLAGRSKRGPHRTLARRRTIAVHTWKLVESNDRRMPKSPD
jgi:hypothetical protein